MEEFTGLQFLESTTQRPAVIITTAYDQYALKGYELNVTDYLLKPFTFERFVKAVDKVTTINEQQEITNIFIKTGYKTENITLCEILYIQGLGEYLKIVTESKQVLTLMNFKNMMDMLPDKNFARVHKSYIISIKKIENMERDRIKIKNLLVPIGSKYKMEFVRKLNLQ